MRAADTIAALADGIGPRRPTSTAERRAAELVADALRDAGLNPSIDPFPGYSTFAAPFGLICFAALAPIPGRAARAALRILAAAGLLSEGAFGRPPLSRALASRRSQNVVAEVEPSSERRRTLALVCHLDTSRSGLLFTPGTGRYLVPWITAQSVAVLALAAEPILARSKPGRAITDACRAVVAAGLALLAERELRGEDVPGANDNASGVGVALELACELAAKPLQHTRVVFLATGCEESGVLGSQAFLSAHDTDGWLFLNFDSVGGPATLRFLEREGLARTWPSDPGLTEVARDIAVARPELGLKRASEPIGLTYDATPVLAGGGRALTFVAGDAGQIPNYHHPSDTEANIDPHSVERALATGREMIRRIDEGEADRTCAPSPQPDRSAPSSSPSR